MINWTNKLDKLDDMSKFLEKHVIKLTQEDRENPNRPIISKEIESRISQQRKA